MPGKPSVSTTNFPVSNLRVATLSRQENFPHNVVMLCAQTLQLSVLFRPCFNLSRKNSHKGIAKRFILSHVFILLSEGKKYFESHSAILHDKFAQVNSETDILQKSTKHARSF